MSLTHIFGGAAVIVAVLSVSAVAQSGMQGSITDVQEGGRKVVLKTSDGKTMTVGVSASRTKVTVAGKEAKRDDLKAGLTCTAVGAAGADATSLDCK